MNSINKKVDVVGKFMESKKIVITDAENGNKINFEDIKNILKSNNYKITDKEFSIE